MRILQEIKTQVGGGRKMAHPGQKEPCLGLRTCNKEGAQGTPVGPVGGGKCLRERCVLQHAQVKLESQGPLGHASPGLRLGKSSTSLELPNTKAQEGLAQVPSSLKFLMSGSPSSTKSGCSEWHWQRRGLLSGWN